VREHVQPASRQDGPPPSTLDNNNDQLTGSEGAGAVPDPNSYVARAAVGLNQRRPVAGPARPVALPIPTHGHSPKTVLIDLQAAKPTANRDDRSRFVLFQLGVDPQAVTSLFVEPVTQLYAVTFNQQEGF
jgi:hypothetical protein